MQVKLVTDYDVFVKLLPHWDLLYDSLDEGNIFYSSSWAFLSYKHFMGDSALFLVVVEDKGVVVAIAPFKITSKRVLGKRIKVLSHLNDMATDYCAILIDSRFRLHKILRKILTVIVKESDRWDFIQLDNFNSREKASRQFFELARDAGIRNLGSYVNVVTPSARLQSNKYTFDKKQLKDIERREKKLKQSCDVKIHISSSFDEEVWKKLVSLHRDRYPGVGFNLDSSQQFYMDVIKDPLLSKQIDLSFLTVDDCAVAVHFGFKDGKRLYYYVPSFDHSYSKNAVGQILLKKMIFHYQGLGYEIFDFLRGNEEYKYYWCDDIHLNFSFVGTSPKAGIAVSVFANLWIMFKTVPLLRAVYGKMKP